MSKAKILAGAVSAGGVLADGAVSAAEVSGLAAVATSGSYNDLSGVADTLTGAAISSASTINLNTATGNRVHVTGTTTITAVTLTRGPRTVIFDGILTLTHHATNNNLPGAANITTAAGDRAIYESDGTTVYCVSYVKVSGAAVVGGGTLVSTTPVISGSSVISNSMLTITINFSASSQLVGGSIASFKIDYGDGSAIQTVVAVNNASSATYTYLETNTPGTTLTLKVTAVDNLGNASAASLRTMTFQNNNPPAGTITSNAPATIYAGNTSVTFAGATDSDGTIVSYKVTNISNANVTVSTAIVAAGSAHTFAVNSAIGTTAVSVSYTVSAIDDIGEEGAASNRTILARDTTPGQAAFTTAGTFSWVAPEGVNSVSVVAIGGGGTNFNTTSSGGGGLGWRNAITVIPGQSYAVVVGAERQASSFNTNSVVGGAGTGTTGGTFTGQGGGNGGNPYTGSTYGGGGGAGGYTGNGGNGGVGGSGSSGAAGSGGGAGGGSGGAPGGYGGGYGGGVGLFGQGSSGAESGSSAGYGLGGNPGSGGTAGVAGGESGKTAGTGGRYGGGAAGQNGSTHTGHQGAIRIIWGSGRAFPSTLTGDL